MLESYLEKLQPYILELFKNDYSGHDFGHLKRTMQLALYLQQKEGGDRTIIGIAALVHDMHRAMQIKEGHFVSPKDSLPKIRELLEKVALTEEQINEICYCVENHEQYNWNGNNITNINALILQDADNLDAIGAIGIGRIFTYCGANQMPMYDENIPLNINSDYNEDSGNDESATHHFYHKLSKLKDNMNTETGKILATKKHECMTNFVTSFLNEWNGIY